MILKCKIKEFNSLKTITCLAETFQNNILILAKDT